MAWYLGWTSGESGYDSNEHSHKECLNLVDFSSRGAVKMMALRKWDEIKRTPDARREVYRNPELIWAEPLDE